MPDRSAASAKETEPVGSLQHVAATRILSEYPMAHLTSQQRTQLYQMLCFAHDSGYKDGWDERAQQDASPVEVAINQAAFEARLRERGDAIVAALSQGGGAAVQQEPDALAEMEARKDGAYLERNQVVAALAKCFPSGVARTAIEGWSEDWHGCVYIDLPTGQASWHFHDSQAYLFAGLPPYTKPWDGHDTPTKYERLAALAVRVGREPLTAEPRLAYSLDEERYTEDLDDIMSQLEDAGNLIEGATYWVGEVDARPASHYVDGAVDDVIERAQSNAFEHADEYADDFAMDVSPAARAELQAAIGAWADKHLQITFWTVTKTRQVEVTADDVRDYGSSDIAGGEERDHG